LKYYFFHANICGEDTNGFKNFMVNMVDLVQGANALVKVKCFAGLKRDVETAGVEASSGVKKNK
jgi:hypothetical protein